MLVTSVESKEVLMALIEKVELLPVDHFTKIDLTDQIKHLKSPELELRRKNHHTSRYSEDNNTIHHDTMDDMNYSTDRNNLNISDRK